MDTFCYPLLTLGYVVLFAWSFRSFRESSFWGTSWLLFLMVVLFYDNFILSIGRWIGVGETLEVLSLLRYLLSVFLTPTLVFVAWDILRRLHVEWAEYLSTRILYNLYTFLVTVMGVFTEILWVTFRPQMTDGVLHYVPQFETFPIAIFLIILPVLFSAIMLWKKSRWPILLWGVGLSIVGGTLAFGLQQVVWIQMAEFILILSLVLTEWHLRHEDYNFHRLDGVV